MKYQLDYTTAFTRDLKRIKKRGYDLGKLNTVVNAIQAGEQLDTKYRDHALTGNWVGFRECHIQPDWLLVYRVYEDRLLLVLTRTGTTVILIYHKWRAKAECCTVSRATLWSMWKKGRIAMTDKTAY